MDLKKLEAKKINDLPSMEVGHMLLCKTEEELSDRSSFLYKREY